MLSCVANGAFPDITPPPTTFSFLKSEAIADSRSRVLERSSMIAEQDQFPHNTHPYGEPQLGRRGLYRAIGGQHDKDDGSALDQMTLLWILNLADGQHSLLDIAQRSGKRFEAVVAATDALREAGLIDDGDRGRGQSGREGRIMISVTSAE